MIRLVTVPVALLLAGCASISIEPGNEVSTQKPPEKIYVALFDTSKGEFNVDREDNELAEFKKDLQEMMQTGITVDLSKRLTPASAWHPGHLPPHEHAWLIRGEFVRVNQGSRLLRGAIGFGAGATKLETNVTVDDARTHQRIMSFSTTGGSNAEPGAITSFATDPLTLAIQAAASGAGNVAHGLTEDTKRTAREITAQLSDYMYRHGWIPSDQWVKPKIYDN